MNVFKNLKYTYLALFNYQSKRFYGSRPYWLPKLLYYFKGKVSEQGPQLEKPRCSLHNWDYKSELCAFSNRIAIPLDFDHMQNVFVHPYYSPTDFKNQHLFGDTTLPNPELYFKHLENGFTYINSIIMAYLRYSFVKSPEELLLSIKNYIMTDKHLSNIALHIGMKDLIISNEYPPSESSCAQSFKCLVGVTIHKNELLEFSKENANKFILDFLLTSLLPLDLFELWPIKNVYNLFQSVITTNSPLLKLETRFLFRCYINRLICSNGINTLFPTYIVGLYVEKTLISQGIGETIPIAIDQAAREALKIKFGFPSPNIGCSLDFEYDRILPILSDQVDAVTGAFINSNFNPNPSIRDMMAEPVDFEVKGVKELEDFSKGYSSQFVSPEDNPVTLTHDAHMYRNVIK